MLYRFKSKACADVVMLALPGKALLEALGKDTQGPGILQPADMTTALQRLDAAAQADRALREAHAQALQARKEAQAQHLPAPSMDDVPQPVDSIALQVRFKPFTDMIRHSLREDCPIVWGV